MNSARLLCLVGARRVILYPPVNASGSSNVLRTLAKKRRFNVFPCRVIGAPPGKPEMNSAFVVVSDQISGFWLVHGTTETAGVHSRYVLVPKDDNR